MDFNKIEIGETSQDINEKCLQLCKDYLSGNWSQQTVDTIEVRRITGGFINQIYFCGIKEPDTNESVPQEVVIKLYGTNLQESVDSSRNRDVIIALIMSEYKLGPKIYAIFEDGQIQNFYKHRQFTDEEHKDPQLREQVFKTLAKIHSLDVPIKKSNNCMAEVFTRLYMEAHEKYPIDKEINEFNYEFLKNCDLKAEMDLVFSVAETSRSPVIFTHNDFRSSNLLITEPNDELIVCDYDLTGYGYRGFDFAPLSREWGRKKFDFFPFEGISFNEEELKPLISIYVEECVKIHGKNYSENEINSVDNILKEVKIFSLMYALLIILWLLSYDQNSGNGFAFKRKDCMEMSDKIMENYFRIKDKLKKQKIID